MKKSVQRLVLVIIWGFILYACEKDVVLNLADVEGAYVVVEANITDRENQQWIRLSHSSSYYEVDQGKPVTGAFVVVKGAKNRFVFTEAQNDSLKGFYFNYEINSQMQEMEEYTLEIIYEDKEYTATSILNPVPVLDSVTIKLNPFSELGFSDEMAYDVFAHFKELESTGDHYLFNLYINRNLKTHRPTEKAPVSDVNLEEQVSWAAITIGENNIAPGDTLILEIRSISRENFNFYNIFFFQTDLSGNPFAGAPPANIPTNLSEGARGFFQVSKVNRKGVIFQP